MMRDHGALALRPPSHVGEPAALMAGTEPGGQEHWYVVALVSMQLPVPHGLAVPDLHGPGSVYAMNV